MQSVPLVPAHQAVRHLQSHFARQLGDWPADVEIEIDVPVDRTLCDIWVDGERIPDALLLAVAWPQPITLPCDGSPAHPYGTSRVRVTASLPGTGRVADLGLLQIASRLVVPWHELRATLFAGEVPAPTQAAYEMNQLVRSYAAPREDR